MGTLERRVQVLFDADRYARLEQEAQRTGQSVGAYIRAAVDDRLRVGRVDREAAWARLEASAAEGIGRMPDPDSDEFPEMLDSYWTKEGPE
ncbi:MAG TPA: hypothetical protein VNQ52_03735 [Microbacteriaceae bacterium]|nr:hypothetical protein [Microbacteriaceae bacterium]